MPLPGLAAGAVFGVLAVWSAVLIVALTGGSTGGPERGVLILSLVGGLLGATIGLVCGVPVGLVLMFVVGRDPGAGRRAVVGATATHAVSLVGLMAAVGFGFVGFGTLLIIGSSLGAGLVAWWFHGRLVDRARLQDARAD